MINKDRIILVTGASKGIGQAAAIELAKSGAHIIALARSTGALEKLDDDIRRASGQSATLITLDLKDTDSIDRLAAPLLERFGRLDGLLANAGMLGPIGPLEAAKPLSVKDTFNVNLMANWHLIRALHPLLKASQAGRALFLTSNVVPNPRAFWGPYQASKAGLEALVSAWAFENEQGHLRINSFDPGATATDMRKTAMPGEDPATLPQAADVAAKIPYFLSPQCEDHNQRIRFRDLV